MKKNKILFFIEILEACCFCAIFNQKRVYTKIGNKSSAFFFKNHNLYENFVKKIKISLG